MNLGGSVHLEAFGDLGGVAAATRLHGVEELRELPAVEAGEHGVKAHISACIHAESVAHDGGYVGDGEFPVPGAVAYRPYQGGGIGLGCVVGHGFEANDSAEGVAERHIVFLAELAP